MWMCDSSVYSPTSWIWIAQASIPMPIYSVCPQVDPIFDSGSPFYPLGNNKVILPVPEKLIAEVVRASNRIQTEPDNSPGLNTLIQAQRLNEGTFREKLILMSHSVYITPWLIIDTVFASPVFLCLKIIPLRIKLHLCEVTSKLAWL